MNGAGIVRIGEYEIGAGRPPFIVAELSGNHRQSMERALALVDAAAAAGAQAVKIQTYTADTMTLDIDHEDFRVAEDGPWGGRSLYELYREAHTPWDWHETLFRRCREKEMLGFSTPFDATAVDFLESLDVPLYKIASFEIVDLALIRKVAATGKPVMMSTGMATRDELGAAVQAAGGAPIILLKCTSSYPASTSSSNLLTIPDLARTFDCPVGLSDHTLGIGASVAAVALGATVIERHLTFRREEGGVDASFSLEPEEFATMVHECRNAWQALGTVHYGVTDEEKPSLRFRRSLYVVKDIRAGDVFSAENVRAIRPGYGLPPKMLPQILGRRAKRDLPRGSALTWDAVMEEMTREETGGIP